MQKVLHPHPKIFWDFANYFLDMVSVGPVYFIGMGKVLPCAILGFSFTEER
jgi:hypothetical protein